MNGYLEFGAAGEVKLLLQQGSDLPRCALFKVARHLFKGRQAPFLEEGKKTLFNILAFCSHLHRPPLQKLQLAETFLTVFQLIFRSSIQKQSRDVLP